MSRHYKYPTKRLAADILVRVSPHAYRAVKRMMTLYVRIITIHTAFAMLLQGRFRAPRGT